MKKTAGIIITVLVLAICGLAGYAYFSKKGDSDSITNEIERNFVAASDKNGQIEDHLIGNKDAKVKIIEYADYQCPACAVAYPYMHDVILEYGDQVSFIFRPFVLSYHANGTAAASAAEAAGLQGYWDEYSMILFKNQSEWEDTTGTERDDLLDKYFNQASDGKGDLAKFRSDLSSQAIKDKINYDRKLAKKAGLTATPFIRINGEEFEFTTVNESEFKASFRARINAALRAAK